MSAPDPEIPPGAIVVCMPAASNALFADDAFSPCAEGCGKMLRHRPYVPSHARTVCLPCAQRVVRLAVARGEPVDRRGTAMTRKEVALYRSSGTKQ